MDANGSHDDLWDSANPHTVAGATGYDTWGAPEGTNNQHNYLGYRGELHTEDLIHLRNRDYDPTTGTFTTPDPLFSS
jgi:hypothetical protein